MVPSDDKNVSQGVGLMWRNCIGRYGCNRVAERDESAELRTLCDPLETQSLDQSCGCERRGKRRGQRHDEYLGRVDFGHVRQTNGRAPERPECKGRVPHSAEHEIRKRGAQNGEPVQ